jgi:hypothetical protein
MNMVDYVAARKSVDRLPPPLLLARRFAVRRKRSDSDQCIGRRWLPDTTARSDER